LVLVLTFYVATFSTFAVKVNVVSPETVCARPHPVAVLVEVVAARPHMRNLP